jgi:hypothetical protein
MPDSEIPATEFTPWPKDDAPDGVWILARTGDKSADLVIVAGGGRLTYPLRFDQVLQLVSTGAESAKKMIGSTTCALLHREI